MATYYVCTLQLHCNHPDANVQRAFADRWPRALQRTWARFTRRTLEGLEESLNRRVWNECKPHIRRDLGVVDAKVETFRADAWAAGDQNQIVQRAPVRLVQRATPTLDWTFRNAAGIQGRIFASAEVTRVTFP
mgnify:CR=1 FL=1